MNKPTITQDQKMASRVEVNVGIITNNIQEQFTLGYIMHYNHFDFFIDLFRKYLKNFDQSTNDRQIMLQVQSIMNLFFNNIMEHKINDKQVKIVDFESFDFWSFFGNNRVFGS